MAQNDKKNSTDGIIELIDIVEVAAEKTPTAQVIDFDSQLSDLLGKGKTVTLNDSPGLEELLSDLGDNRSANEQPAERHFSEPEPFPGESVGDLTDNLFGLNATDSDDEPHAPPSTNEIRRASNPMSDVDSFIDQLDVPPSENRTSQGASAGEPKPDVEDLDSLLDSLFSSPAAGQIGAPEQEKPAPPAQSPDDSSFLDMLDEPKPSKTSRPEMPRVNADELDALLNPPDEDAAPPPRPAAKAPEKKQNLDDDFPDLDSLLSDILPDSKPAVAAPAPAQDDLGFLDFAPPAKSKPSRPSVEDLRLQDKEDITAILDEAMPVFDQKPFRPAKKEAADDFLDVLGVSDTKESEQSELFDLPILPDIDVLTEQGDSGVQEDRAKGVADKQAAPATDFPALSALDERLARLETGLHSLNQRIATLEEQVAPSPLSDFADLPVLGQTPAHAASNSGGSSSMQNLEDLLTEGNTLCEQLKTLVRTLIAAELPEPPDVVNTPDPHVEAISTLQKRLAFLESQVAAIPKEVPKGDTPDPHVEAIATLQKRLAFLESQVAAIPEEAPKGDTPDPHVEAIAALQERLITLELQSVAIPEEMPDIDTPDPHIEAIAALQERLAALESQLAALPEETPEIDTPDPHVEAITTLQERLAVLEARPEPEPVKFPDIPDSASIAEDVLALVRVDMEKVTSESAPQIEATDQTLVDLQARLEALEERSVPHTEGADQALLDLQARLEALEERPIPQTEEADQAFIALQTRLEVLEERPTPPPVLPELPDVEAIKREVVEQVRGDLDKFAAEAAARLLREEIAALLSLEKENS